MSSIAELQQQVEYWRSRSEKYERSCKESQDELDEFQRSSKELEEEMETQLEQAEKRLSDQISIFQKQNSSYETLKEKYYTMQQSKQGEIEKLEGELDVTRYDRDIAQRAIRELEQSNDDLERAKRMLVTSLDDFEKRMNDAIERNAFLENELDEKEALLTSVQRLKEETRDLKQELNVRERVRSRVHSGASTTTGIPVPEARNGSIPHASPIYVPSAIPTPVMSNSKDKRSSSRSRSSTPARASIGRSQTVDSTVGPNLQYTSSIQGSHPLTPSARISALNIVGDLLRKVGALESKLASCKKYPTASLQGSSTSSHQQLQQQQPNNSFLTGSNTVTPTSNNNVGLTGTNSLANNFTSSHHHQQLHNDVFVSGDSGQRKVTIQLKKVPS